MIIKSEMILCKYCSLLFGVWPAIQWESFLYV
jgi:hypothetical protein